MTLDLHNILVADSLRQKLPGSDVGTVQDGIAKLNKNFERGVLDCGLGECSQTHSGRLSLLQVLRNRGDTEDTEISQGQQGIFVNLRALRVSVVTISATSN